MRKISLAGIFLYLLLLGAVLLLIKNILYSLGFINSYILNPLYLIPSLIFFVTPIGLLIMILLLKGKNKYSFLINTIVLLTVFVFELFPYVYNIITQPLYTLEMQLENCWSYNQTIGLLGGILIIISCIGFYGQILKK